MKSVSFDIHYELNTSNKALVPHAITTDTSVLSALTQIFERSKYSQSTDVLFAD